MNAAAANVAPARIDALDGLRALAMTAVVAQHCHLLPFGWTGVWLFFLISGYVITLGFDAGEYAGRGAAERFGTFIARRAARIVPAYLLYLAACTLVALSLGNAAAAVEPALPAELHLQLAHDLRLAGPATSTGRRSVICGR